MEIPTPGKTVIVINQLPVSFSGDPICVAVIILMRNNSILVDGEVSLHPVHLYTNISLPDPVRIP